MTGYVRNGLVVREIAGRSWLCEWWVKTPRKGKRVDKLVQVKDLTPKKPKPVKKKNAVKVPQIGLKRSVDKV